MHEKDIKRIVREQLKKKHPNWKRLAKKQKKQFAREVTDAVIAEYAIYNQELDVPIESLIGIEEQQVDSKIIPLQDMADFVDNFHQKSGVIDFAKYRKPCQRFTTRSCSLSISFLMIAFSIVCYRMRGTVHK